MQAAERILAQRYSRALFEVGVEEKQEERLQKDLVDSAKILRDQLSVFQNPQMSAARQKTVLKNMVGAKISARALKFLELLIDKKRFSLLPLIAVDYGAMADARRGTARAQVRAAQKLTEAEQSRLRRDLGKFFGKEVILDVKESPDLLGGMVVHIGDWVLDGSLQGKLRRLAAQLVEES